MCGTASRALATLRRVEIGTFDVGNAIHNRIADIGSLLEAKATAFGIDENVHFAAVRRHIRDSLFESAEGVELNERPGRVFSDSRK